MRRWGTRRETHSSLADVIARRATAVSTEAPFGRILACRLADRREGARIEIWFNRGFPPNNQSFFKDVYFMVQIM
jgi:hypothetical protein